MQRAEIESQLFPDIIIPDPSINKDPYRRYSNKETVQNTLKAHLPPPESQLLGPALDLFSGDAAIPSLLLEIGWQPPNIFAIDKHRTNTPLTRAPIHWHYWDLEALAERIENNQPLTQEISALKASCSLVTIAFGYAHESHKQSLVSYFRHPQGHAFILEQLEHIHISPKRSQR